MVSLLRATGEIDLGKITLPGVKDCPISGEKLPLDTAETVVDASFIVAVVTHPDLSRDTSRFGFLSRLVERSTDIKRLIDFMLGASPAVPTIDPQRIGFFGFSLGDYTGLVLIGANPDWATAPGFCQAYQLCGLIRGKEFPAEALAHDPRIKAAVLADAGPIFFTAGSFAAIKVTIRLWASERGGPQRVQCRCARVLSGTPDAGTATMTTPDCPPIGGFVDAAA